MTAVVVRHNPLLSRIGLALLSVFLLALVAAGIHAVFMPWLYDRPVPMPFKLSSWERIGLGLGLVGLAGKHLWDVWRTRHGYFERLTVSDAGINVESDSNPALFVRWANVEKVDRPARYLIVITVKDRPRPICLIRNGYDRNFLLAEQLVQKHSGTECGKKWWKSR